MRELSKGFSLLEIVIVIALLGILATLSSSFYGSFTKSTDLDAAAQTIVSDLRSAQAKAMAGYDVTGDGISDTWGVCFRNPAGDDLYEIISPAGACSQASSSTVRSTVYLQSGVAFDTLGGNNFKSVIFNKIAGTTTSASNITVNISSNGQTKTITITSAGLVSSS